MASLGLIAAFAFKVWMVVDALQRGIPVCWLFSVACVPFADWVYFLAVKLPELNPSRFVPRRRPSLELVRAAHAQSPSLENQLWLARSLYDAGEYAEAADLYEQAIQRDASYPRAFYGLGLARLALGDAAGAVEALEGAVELDPSCADHRASVDLAHALQKDGQATRAVEVLRSLVQRRPRLDHSVVFAAALQNAGREAEAREHLERELRELELAPRHVRRLSRRAANAARSLLARLPRQTIPVPDRR